MSTSLRTSIPILRLIHEISQNMPVVHKIGNTVKCQVYEDNESMICMAHIPKSTHRTKHISTKVHHFREYVGTKAIHISHVSPTQQLADIFTKPLPTKAFTYLRTKLMGWRAFPFTLIGFYWTQTV